MPILFEPLPVYFMHIPKTGGTALGQWLKTIYSRRDYVDLKPLSLYRIPQSSLSRFRCFHSWHLGSGMYDLIGRSDLPITTMLRDPIERAASDIRYFQRVVLQRPASFSPEYVSRLQPLTTKTISDCVMSGIFDTRIHDAQTRIVGLRQNYEPVFQCRSQEDARALLYSSYPFEDQPKNLDIEFYDTDRAQRAHAWLDTMAVVGLTERYTETLHLIADLVGIPVPGEPPSANVNPERTHRIMRYRDHLEPAARARLEELNRDDQELYAHATALFQEQWARYQAKPRRTYSIAAHLRLPVSKVARPTKDWLRRSCPGLVKRIVHIRRASRKGWKQH